MKTRYLIAWILVLASGLQTRGQEADTLMKLVLAHNRDLIVAREATQAAILRAGTGNTPPDPEVEFGYLFGDPAAIGHKINIVVKQQVDFPTSYIHRSRLKDIRSGGAELSYLQVRQEVLTNARKLWIEQLYLNQLQLLLEERLQIARDISLQSRERLEAGEVGALEYSQSRLVEASAEAEYEETRTALQSNLLGLQEIAGGQPVEINDTLFPARAEIMEDSLLVAYRESPGALLQQAGREEKESQVDLARSQHLPRLSAGYFSEAVSTEAFRGFTLGLSLPLWENTRTVNTARTEVLWAEAEQERYLIGQEKEIRQKLLEHAHLQNRVETLEEAMGAASPLDILETSMESGEISLAEYFYTSDFYFRNQQLLLRYKRDLLQVEADLMKIYL